MTRRCNLACLHCRASSKDAPYAGELSAEEARGVVDQISDMGRPIVILTGGEPLLREDVFDIAAYGRSRGLTMVIAPNGTLLTADIARRLVRCGIKRVSISLDGPDAGAHNRLRQVDGAFEGAVRGIEFLRRANLEFQINSTISRENIALLPQIIRLGRRLRAAGHHIFLLVPCGRGRDMRDKELSAKEYEQALEFLAGQQRSSAGGIKVTCAPHFNRMLLQSGLKKRGELRGRGCMAGTGFCFISHIGDVQPCGYLEIKCGNVRQTPLKEIWFGAEVFSCLRSRGKYKGKCRQCEFFEVCSGCRARAFAKCGDYLAEEPCCGYVPKRAG